MSISRSNPTQNKSINIKSKSINDEKTYSTNRPRRISLAKKKQQKEGKRSIFQHILLVPVIFEGVDVTPVNLNPLVYEHGKERQISILDALQLREKDASLTYQSLTGSRVESQRFQANIIQQNKQLEAQTIDRHSIITSFSDDVLITGVMNDSYISESVFSKETSVDNETVEKTAETVVYKIPENFSLILQETDTMFLLDIPSCTVPRESEQADAVEEDNRMYEYITRGKGRNRKMLTVGIQTVPTLMKGRDTETDKIRFRNNSTFVSNWEMYDTFAGIKDQQEEESECFSSSDEEDPALDVHKLNAEASLESFRLSAEEKYMNKLVKSKVFYDALIVIERILGNNCYNKQQKRFKGLSDPDVFREDIQYKYRLEHMWTYANDDTEGKCVTGIAFNSFLEDIVAVAYGKYFYMDRNSVGMVMIWNIKNPQQPERHYNFPSPVTSIAFSNVNPNILAVGFYSGHLNIVDISKRELNIIRQNIATSFEPLWSLLWFRQENEEDIMVSYGDGRVCKNQIASSHHLKSTQIMITATAEGKLKGIKYLKKCEDKDVSITQCAEARCLTLHPIDPFTYFVGTSEGVVHRCSTNYYNEHMDLFKAHDGAIHTIKFSPFANKLYYTCGDDFRTRLWADGIQEPLVTSEPSILPVLDVDWSPSHATIIASIRGTDILVWDLQRKMYESQSITKSPSNSFNTVCRFTANGRCLMVGDMSGNVHVFSLEDMPIPPFFSEDLMMNSLKRILVTRPDLIKKLRKLGSLNFDKTNFSKYFH